jgi:hypothetical protein
VRRLARAPGADARIDGVHLLVLTLVFGALARLAMRRFA